jgi:hypothetical protein
VDVGQIINTYNIIPTATGWLFNETDAGGAGCTFLWSIGCQTVPALSFVGAWSNDMGMLSVEREFD